MKRSSLFFLLVFVLACAVRGVYLLDKRPFAVAGSAEMERAAASLVRDSTLGNVYGDNSGPSAHVAPLYPLFLSVIYTGFGYEGPAARLAQEVAAILMSATGIALLPWLARRAGLHPGAGWAAAVALAVLPINLWIETSGSWEQPASALLLLALLITCLAWQGIRQAVLFGLLTGAAALLSPALLPAAGLMLLATLFSWQGGSVHSWRPRILGGATVALVSLLVISPWIYRNHQVLGGFVPLRSNFGLELWIGNHPGSNGKTFDLAWDDRDSFVFQNHPLLNGRERDRLRQVGELEYMRGKQSLARAWIASHPGEFLELTARRFQLFWFPGEDLWPASSPGNWLKAVLFTFFGLGMFGELFCLFLTRHASRFLLAGAVLGPALVYLVTHVDSRYRYPVFGLSAVLCAHLGVRVLRWLPSFLTMRPGVAVTSSLRARPEAVTHQETGSR
jgi:hypothetical protein